MKIQISATNLVAQVVKFLKDFILDFKSYVHFIIFKKEKREKRKNLTRPSV